MLSAAESVIKSFKSKKKIKKSSQGSKVFKYSTNASKEPKRYKPKLAKVSIESPSKPLSRKFELPSKVSSKYLVS